MANLDMMKSSNEAMLGWAMSLANSQKMELHKQKIEQKIQNLKDADIIISSPYTRALQTAAIISRETGIKLVVENDLHEWMPDTKFIYDYEVSGAFQEYFEAEGKRNVSHKYRWESYEDLKKRVQLTLLKYKNYKKVIVVCHGIVMSSLTRFDDIIEHCGVREVDL